MKKIKTTCYLCGEVTKSEEAPATCPRCMADLTDPTAETVQKTQHCQFTTGSLGGSTGWLYLTNRRLLWVKDSSTGVGGAVGGVVGALAEHAISNAMGAGKLGFSIPLCNIGPMEDSKIGLLAKAITISTKSDGVMGKLGISKRDAWKSAIEQAVSAAAR